MYTIISIKILNNPTMLGLNVENVFLQDRNIILKLRGTLEDTGKEFSDSLINVAHSFLVNKLENRGEFV